MCNGDKNRFLRRLTPIVFFLVCFVCGYHILGSLSLLHGFRIRGEFEFEKTIPFVPWMIFVYWSIAIQFAALPFVFTSTQKLWAKMKAMVIATGIAVIFFIFLPFENSLTKNTDGVWLAIFRFADSINLDRNFFPSLHCCFAVMSIRPVNYRGRAHAGAWENADGRMALNFGTIWRSVE